IKKILSKIKKLLK
nr:Chain A, ILE-LYS-LYS-ILE-LEU-SER-LYS-ILE-LYS-LYS-LEU-LEU-LYS [Rana chensinensis]